MKNKGKCAEVRDRIRLLCKRKGVTPSQMARSCDLTEWQAGAILDGKSSISVHAALKVAKYLDTTVDTMYNH